MTSSARLQQEADQARAGLSTALEDLKSSVTTTALTNGALTFAKDGSNAVAKAAVDRAMANPFAALMIGAGIAMLMMGDKKVGSAIGGLVEQGKSAVRSATDSVTHMGSDAAAAASGKASGLADQASDLAGRVTGEAKGLIEKGEQQATDLLHKGEEQGKQLVDQAQHLIEEHRGRFEQFAQEQPILVAALGVAFGAAIGASLPITKAEQQYLGATAKQAMDKGSNLALEVADTVTDQLSGRNVAHKVSEVVEAVSTKVAQGISRS
jgi:ElaB/YqjD/DUF883 family membrane-anchored ribosome-binding protein